MTPRGSRPRHYRIGPSPAVELAADVLTAIFILSVAGTIGSLLLGSARAVGSFVFVAVLTAALVGLLIAFEDRL